MSDPVHDLSNDAERRRFIALLGACVVAAEAGQTLDATGLADELGMSVDAVEQELDHLEAFGLIAPGAGAGESPVVRRAGHQYLARDGRIPRWQLHFLGQTIDDLTARAALLHAGSAVIDSFRAEMLAGRGTEHAARAIVPRAFSEAIDDRIAIDLYAAAGALIARLSADEPAGCVAEEIVAVRLIDEARTWLEALASDGQLDHDELDAAAEELDALFELFQDDDVIDLFAMSEPADAALALHDPAKQRLGFVDQRVQSWFTPFGWTAPTGYLAAEPPR